MYRPFLSSIALCPLILGNPVLGWTQNAKQQPQQRSDLQCTGVVKEVGAGVFQLTAEDGEQWLIKVEAQPQSIVYTGSADESFLRPGLFVRLAGQINRRGQLEEKIDSLTVITPKADTPLGLNAEQSKSAGEGLFTDPKAEKKSKAKPKLGTDVLYDIVGRIAKITPTELTIDAAGTQVRAQLAENVSVSLELADLSYIRPGDKVEMGGWYLAGQKGRAFANRITVTAAEPLSAGTAPVKKGKIVPSKQKAADSK